MSPRRGSAGVGQCRAAARPRDRNRARKEVVDVDHASTDAELAENLREITTRLARIYEQILGVENVTIDDDFFVLGGTSISAIELLKVVGNEMTKVPVRDFYQATVVSDLARTVQDLRIRARGDP